MFESNVNIKDEEVIHIVDMLKKALTFDLTEPVHMEGELGLYDGDITITMDNEEFIALVYKYPLPGDDFEAKNEVSISNRAFVDLGNEDSLCDLMRMHYKKYLKSKIRVVQ